MDDYLQRMIHRFQEQVFQRMPPERNARKLAVMKALAKSVRTKYKENESPLNNKMELSSNFTHSTPMKNHQVTDLDDIESDIETETELEDSELCSIAEEETEGITGWQGTEEPELVIPKIYDLADGRSCGDSKNSSEFPSGDESLDAGVTILSFKELDDSKEKHWRSLEVLHETAEYEFCKSLEQSKFFVSTASLLEEIEADLPSRYSLAKPFNHTFHTLSTYRTQTRLARMDANATCPEILKQRESFDLDIFSNKVENLEMEAEVQKALAEQAEKAVGLSKVKKFLGVQHLESEKALLLADLRGTAALQEAKKLKMLGEVSEKENFGQISIFEICFEVYESKDGFPGKYICTVTERENVQATEIVDEVTDGKLCFNEPIKLQNLSKDFVIYVDLFKLIFKEPKKALITSALMKKFKKMSGASLTSPGVCRGGFVCVSQSELRLENVVNGEDGRFVLQNYLTRNLRRPEAGNTVSLFAKTDIQMKSKRSGFLNMFRHTWYRRWFSQSGYFLESWHYPEDQESNKAPLDSIFLPDCRSVETVGLEVCVRPHSFVISLKDNDEELLFSANSHKDMFTWVDHLNLMLEQIRLWKPKL